MDHATTIACVKAALAGIVSSCKAAARQPVDPVDAALSRMQDQLQRSKAAVNRSRETPQQRQQRVQQFGQARGFGDPRVHAVNEHPTLNRGRTVDEGIRWNDMPDPLWRLPRPPLMREPWFPGWLQQMEDENILRQPGFEGGLPQVRRESDRMRVLEGDWRRGRYYRDEGMLIGNDPYRMSRLAGQELDEALHGRPQGTQVQPWDWGLARRRSGSRADDLRLGREQHGAGVGWKWGTKAGPRGMTGSERVRAGYPRNAVEDATWDRRLRQIYRGLPGDPHIQGGEQGLVRGEKRLRGEMDDWARGRYTSDTARLADDDWRNANPRGRWPTPIQREGFREQFFRDRMQTLPGELRMDAAQGPRAAGLSPWERFQGVIRQILPGTKASPYRRAYTGYGGVPRPRTPRLLSSGIPRPAADPFGAYGVRRVNTTRLPRVLRIPNWRGY